MTTAIRNDSRLLPVLVCASGAAGLAYEVLWVRDWALLYGATAAGTAVVLAAYFGGLAVGAWGGGRLANAARGLKLYALLEASLALSVLLYVVLRPGLPQAAAWLAHSGPVSRVSPQQILFAFAVLLIPTALLGATLPAVTAVLHPGDAQGAGRLYAWNTLGGALGALVCGIVAVRALGIRGSFCAAAAVDVAVATGAFLLSRSGGGASTLERPLAVVSSERSRPLAAAIVAATGGFVGLAGEVLWTRGLTGVLSNSVYSVALVLTAVLIGLVIGTWLGVRVLRRPGTLDARVAIAAALLAVSVWGSALGIRALAPLSMFLIRTVGVTSPMEGFIVEALLALATVLTPAVVLGALFPLSLALDGTRAPGASVGRLLAVNTAAGICGALAGAFILLPRLGLGGGLFLLAGLAAVVSFGFAERASIRGLAAAVAIIVLATAMRGPSLQLPWREVSADRTLFYRDGATATVAVTTDARGNKRLRINGQYSLGGTQGLLLEAREAYVPLLLHPAPQRMLALGVGTGDTVGAAVAHPNLQVVGVELVAEALDAARLFAPENRAVLDNPRARLLAEDARSFLLRTTERYDVILSDLFLPWAAGTAALYSQDFYRLGLAHLQPGGLYCQWLPLHQLAVADLQSIVATFASVFPHVELWVAYHRSLTPLAALIGSAAPPAHDEDAVRRRFTDPTLRRALDEVGLDDPADLAALYLTDGARLRAATADAPLITDDRPRIEFTAPAAYFHQHGLGLDALTWLATAMGPDPSPFISVPFALRRALVEAQRALLSGDRPRELAAYVDAVRLDPTMPTVRLALVAIARERLAAGDRATAVRIAGELVRLAPDSRETRLLQQALGAG